jgi:hypothetical protein
VLAGSNRSSTRRPGAALTQTTRTAYPLISSSSIPSTRRIPSMIRQTGESCCYSLTPIRSSDCFHLQSGVRSGDATSRVRTGDLSRVLSGGEAPRERPAPFRRSPRIVSVRRSLRFIEVRPHFHRCGAFLTARLQSRRVTCRKESPLSLPRVNVLSAPLVEATLLAVLVAIVRTRSHACSCCTWVYLRIHICIISTACLTADMQVMYLLI